MRTLKDLEEEPTDEKLRVFVGKVVAIENGTITVKLSRLFKKGWRTYTGEATPFNKEAIQNVTDRFVYSIKKEAGRTEISILRDNPVDRSRREQFRRMAPRVAKIGA